MPACHDGNGCIGPPDWPDQLHDLTKLAATAVKYHRPCSDLSRKFDDEPTALGLMKNNAYLKQEIRPTEFLPLNLRGFLVISCGPSGPPFAFSATSLLRQTTPSRFSRGGSVWDSPWSRKRSRIIWRGLMDILLFGAGAGDSACDTPHPAPQESAPWWHWKVGPFCRYSASTLSRSSLARRLAYRSLSFLGRQDRVDHAIGRRTRRNDSLPGLGLKDGPLCYDPSSLVVPFCRALLHPEYLRFRCLT